MASVHSYAHGSSTSHSWRVPLVMVLAFLLVASSLFLQPLLSQQTPAAAAAGDSFQVKAVETDGSGKPIKTSGFTCSVGGAYFNANTTITVNSGDVKQQAGVTGCAFGRAYVTDGTHKLEISSAVQNASGEIVVTPVLGKYYAAQDDVELTVPVSESAQKIVFEYWSNSGGIPITYDYSALSSSLNFSITGNDFKLDPPNVQWFGKDAQVGGGARYCATAKVELVRGYTLKFASGEADATVSATVVEDYSSGELNAAKSGFNNLKTVQLYKFCYTNSTSVPTQGSIKITTERVSTVNYRIATNPTAQSMSALTNWGQSNYKAFSYNGVSENYAYQFHYGYIYSKGITGAVNVSKMINPFVSKVNKPTDSKGSKQQLWNRTGIPAINGNSSMVEFYTPEYVEGQGSVNNGGRFDQVNSDNAFDFFVQQNGLPHLMLNDVNQDQGHLAPQVVWNYWLSKVSVNGQWMSIPLPQLYKIEANWAGSDYYEDLYRKRRNFILGGLDVQEWRNNTDANPGGSRDYQGCFTNNGLKDFQGTTLSNLPGGNPKSNSDSENAHIYSPDSGRRPFYAYTYEDGPLAGTRVEISLINLRNNLDARGWGWSPTDGNWWNDYSTPVANYWNTQRDWRGNNIDWKFGGGVQGVREYNNQAPLNSSPAPSFSPFRQMTDVSSCSQWLEFANADGAFRDFRQVNTWKSLYRIRIINPTTANLDVQARFDTSVNGAVWNAGSNGVEFNGKPTFGMNMKPDGASAYADYPVCDADSTIAGCHVGLKKWMPDNNPIFKFKLKDGYGQPKIEVQVANAAGGYSNTSEGLYQENDAYVTLTPTASPDTSKPQWAKTAGADGMFTFHFADNINPTICEGSGSNTDAFGVSTSCGSGKAVGYSGYYGARISTKVMSVPVNYRDTNGELVDQAGLVNGQLVNRVYANRYTVLGPVPAGANGKPASSYKLFKRNADGSTAEVASGLIPGQVIDIKQIGGGSGIQLVNQQTGEFAVTELFLVPDSTSTTTGPTASDGYLIYSVQRFAGALAAANLHDYLGDFIAVPGVKAKFIGQAEAPLVHNGASYYYDSTQSELEKTLTATISSSNLKLLYLQRETTVRFDKNWVVNGTTLVDGAQPQQLQSAARLDGAGIKWGRSTAFNQNGTSVTLAETINRDPLFKGCTVDSVTWEKKGATPQAFTVTAPPAGGNVWTASASIPTPVESEDGVTQTNNVSVSYAFVSGTKEYRVPSEVNAVLPASSTAAYGSSVSAPVLTTVRVTESGNTGYTWFFAGWDQQEQVADGAVTFVGKWLRLKTDSQKVSGWRWAWAGTDPLSADGLPAGELPDLPVMRVVSASYITPAYPTGISQGQQITTSKGVVTVDSVNRNGSIVTILLQRPERVNVTYDFKTYYKGNYNSTFDDNIKNGNIANARNWLYSSLPAASTAPKGADIAPAAMRNRVVNVNGTDYKGNGQGASLLFSGWEDPVTDASGNVKFTAKFEFVLWTGTGNYTTKYRGVKFINNSLTTEPGTSTTLNISSAAEAEMQLKQQALVTGFANSPKLTASGSTYSGTWTVPAFAGTTVRDKQLQGTWVFQGFKQVLNDGTSVARAAGTQITVRSGNATPTNDEFPRDGADDRNWTVADGSGADRNLKLIAEWKFVSTPVYTVTNNVTCNSNLHLWKTLGEIDHEIHGAAGEGKVDFTKPNGENNSFEVTMDTNFNGNQLAGEYGDPAQLSWPGNLEVPGGSQYNRTNRTNWLNTNLGVKIGETGSTRSGNTPAPAYAFQGWTCDSGDLNSQDLTTTKATIRFGLGQHVECTAVNTASQLTLFAGQTTPASGSTAWGLGTVQLKAAPKVAVTGLNTLTASQSQKSVASSTSNTVYTKPETDYTVSAPSSVGIYKFVRFERYIGSNKAGVKSDDTSSAWLDLGSGTITAASAAGAAGTAMAAGETNNVLEVTVPTGERIVIRAVYEENSYAPALPLTGGWASDLFFLLGAAALTAGIAGAIAHNRRKGKTNPEVC